MRQKQRNTSNLHLALLIISNIVTFCLFAWLFTTPQAIYGQTETTATRWLPMPQLRSGIGEPSVAVLDNKIHVVGGVESFGPSGFHEAFDPVTQRWESLPDLPHQATNAMAAVLNGKLYIFGGYNPARGGALSSTHIYEPGSESWLTATAMLSPTSGAGVAVINNAIYLFGGYDNVTESSRVQRYDPSADRWTLRAPMPVARSESGLVTLDGLVYMIGGNVNVYTATNRVLTNVFNDPANQADANPLSTLVSVYDPTHDTWRDLAPLPAPRVAMAVAALQGKIYVIGGVDAWRTGTAQSTVFSYDPLRNQWSVEPPIFTPRSGVRAVTLNDILYIIGGYDQAFVPLNIMEAYGLTVKPLYLPILWR